MTHDKTQENNSSEVQSMNSGSYNPGPVQDNEYVPNAESSTVQAMNDDILLEEFPEGPYVAATNETKLGKTSPWKPGQVSVSAFRDSNPVDSDRKTVLHEPEFDAPEGSIEGQN
ncbi:hypothetical protein LLE49_01920 [Alicyclobacillus tolerans]|uniref:hypothetical protein n=1 Tax=Alicyclobacillus tolerans TaxID=90970 RepID=UPI001F262A93|nr:hypothetical protein [Alicyclobacillus tolerans]MCF8563500.1 hypothetical protein [Alicyclobacillus tolerans]